MATNIFVNLPVRDLEASKRFFGALGFAFNPQFTDETAAALVVDEGIYFMLLTHAKFKDFISLPLSDAKKETQALYAISRESRVEVDNVVDAALKAGGTEPRPAQELGFMYSRAFADLDGHIWEFVWMDPSFVQPQ